MTGFVLLTNRSPRSPEEPLLSAEPAQRGGAVLETRSPRRSPDPPACSWRGLSTLPPPRGGTPPSDQKGEPQAGASPMSQREQQVSSAAGTAWAFNFPFGGTCPSPDPQSTRPAPGSTRHVWAPARPSTNTFPEQGVQLRRGNPPGLPRAPHSTPRAPGRACRRLPSPCPPHWSLHPRVLPGCFSRPRAMATGPGYQALSGPTLLGTSGLKCALHQGSLLRSP